MFCDRHRESWLPVSELMRTPADLDVAAGRRVESAHQVEQRRLSGARRPHQRQEVALRDLEVDALQHVDALAAAREVLVDVWDPDEGRSVIFSTCAGAPPADTSIFPSHVRR